MRSPGSGRSGHLASGLRPPGVGFHRAQRGGLFKSGRWYWSGVRRGAPQSLTSDHHFESAPTDRTPRRLDFAPGVPLAECSSRTAERKPLRATAPRWPVALLMLTRRPHASSESASRSVASRPLPATATHEVPDGQDFFTWARQQWPTTRWTVELDPWQLTPKWPRRCPWPSRGEVIRTSMDRRRTPGFQTAAYFPRYAGACLVRCMCRAPGRSRGLGPASSRCSCRRARRRVLR